MAKQKIVEKKEEIPMKVEAPVLVEQPPLVTPPPAIADLKSNNPNDWRVNPKSYPYYDEWQKDSRKVWGTFRDLEVKGGSIKFHYKKWALDQIEDYDLKDGERCELKLGVIKHLNSICNTEDSFSSDLISADGRPMKNPNPKRVNRFSFSPDEYMGGM